MGQLYSATHFSSNAVFFFFPANAINCPVLEVFGFLRNFSFTLLNLFLLMSILLCFLYCILL